MKTSQGILPNLIIIGAMKSGTTSLHRYLKYHPHIFMVQKKELDFFIKERNWPKGIEWYCSQFIGQAKIHGEASPNYTNFPQESGIPQRMYSLVPNAKLIYLLRDPLKRMISHYIHEYACGNENLSITEAFANFSDNSYFDRSRYYFQLEQYLEYFPASNILILTSEELSQSPRQTLKTIFQYLELEDEINLPIFFNKFHRSEVKRRKTNLGGRLSETLLMKKIEQLPPDLSYHAQRILYFPFSQKIENPTLEPKLRQKIADYLRTDIDRLRKYTGCNFKEWCV
jgi:hypothetical protein